ncbi:hypothetical protein R69608_06212 [Paraburkholderia nemoris]|uniref:Major facilitator superfamily (MFS) profile domain-containing protein n=1 Tax=Paraburkholderia nemoris TaxID=2793076 RepID=A0ABM8T5R4_9BURK|nr:hypothetical protein R75777_07211 [Paraburkholderia nemoris]CAE6858755.1 hypothetical protein R69776_07890 [Paraburkholderia nemoris]CAE6957311.1 hypothetical protein R69608_06212 [Paraburkholderia nemoris]
MGETFGGGVAPVIAGFVAQHFGLARTLDFALYSLIAGAVVTVFLVETAPRRRAATTPAGDPARDTLNASVVPSADPSP